MTLKQLEPSDVLGENYYVYNITSSDYNPSLNGSITITCTLKNVYGTAVASKSLTLYQNGTSKGSQTTNSSGVATWSITCSSSGLQTFRIGAAAIEVYVDNKSELGHTHTKSQITDFPTIPDVSGKIDTAGTGLSKSGTTLNHSNSITALTTASFKKVKYDAQGHITGTSDVSASDLPTHTHSQYLTEHQSLANYVTTSDSRLSDARTPLSHAHGNLQNNGQVGSTAQANKNVVTDSSGLITTEDKPTIPSASSTTPSADTTSGSYGSGTTYARSNHTHPKSSLYAEATHSHTKSQISDFPTSMTPTSHASSASTYGLGTTSNYGHVKTINALTQSSHSDGTALSAYQGYLLQQNKVEKETGKGLSTNDFSATYKNKLDDLPTKHITNIYIDNEGYLCVTWNGEQDSK